MKHKAKQLTAIATAVTMCAGLPRAATLLARTTTIGR